MKTAVVILNWNGEKMIQDYLPPIVEKSGDEAQVIIIDNASTDASISFLRNNYPGLKVIQLNKNIGYAGGYNNGLQELESKYDYYVLLNSDVEVTDNWLNPIIKHLDENNDVAACQPKIKDIFNKDKFEHAGAAGGFIDKHGYPFCRGRIFQEVEPDNGQYNANKEIFWASPSHILTYQSHPSHTHHTPHHDE